jgi:hypothetical protein
MPIPGDSHVNRIDTQFAVSIQAVTPQIFRNAVIREISGVNEERAAIHK